VQIRFVLQFFDGAENSRSGRTFYARAPAQHTGNSGGTDACPPGDILQVHNPLVPLYTDYISVLPKGSNSKLCLS
jgi:hypothetical protein